MLGPLWGQPQTRSSACDRATGVDAAFVRLVLLALPVSMLLSTVRGQPFWLQSAGHLSAPRALC